jgi:hypothetical protein
MEVKHYPATSSCLDGMGGKAPHQRAFVNVVNSGTPEYHSSGAASILEQIPWSDCLELLLSGNKDKNAKRGNLQRNYGYAGGNCLVLRTTDEVIDLHFGVSVPSKRVDSEMPMVKELFSKLSELAALPAFGVYWATQVGVDSDFTKRHQLFASTLAPAPSFIELLSIVAVLVKDASGVIPADAIQGVAKHTDDQNADKPYSQVMFPQRVVRETSTGE